MASYAASFHSSGSREPLSPAHGLRGSGSREHLSPAHGSQSHQTSSKNRSGTVSPERERFAREAYRQEGVGGDYSKDHYNLLPTKDSYEHGDHSHHHIRGQTMRMKMEIRKQTDVSCGCGFILFWCIVFWIASVGFHHGDPRRLYHGFDFMGRLCGVAAGVTDKPLLYWPDASRMDLPVCVEQCPHSADGSMVVPKETATITQGTDYVSTEVIRQHVSLATYPSTEVGGRFCLPIRPHSVDNSVLPTGLASDVIEAKTPSELAAAEKSLSNTSKALAASAALAEQQTATAVSASEEKVLIKDIIKEEEFASWTFSAVELFKDICNAWSVLIFMLPVSMAVGYAYILMLRYCGLTVLKFVMALLVMSSASLSFYCLCVYGSDEGEHHHHHQTHMGRYHNHAVFMLGCVSGVFFALLLAAGCSAVGRVEKATAVVEAAGDAMWSVQLLLSMPVFECLTKLAYTLCWMYGARYVLSNGDVDGQHVEVGGQHIQGLVHSFRYSTAQQLMIVVYCFAYVWGLEFIGMVFKFVSSHAVSAWYFQPCRADMTKPEVSTDVWQRGFIYALFYHFGSLVLGAFCMILLYLFLPLKSVTETLAFSSFRAEGLNPLANAIAHSCSCFVRCSEEITSFVHKGSIVEMVLRGDMGFFDCVSSASRILHISERTQPAVRSLHGITLVFQIIGVVAAAGIGMFSTFWFTATVNIYADRRSDYYIEDQIGIAIVGGIISALNAAVFTWSIDLVSETLLFCWLVEGEDDRTHLTYAPKALRNVVMFDDLSTPKDTRLLGVSGNWHSSSFHSTSDGTRPTASSFHHDDPASPHRQRDAGGWASSPTTSGYNAIAQNSYP